MLTRCPYLNCRQTFELAEPAARAGECPFCHLPVSYRPLDSIAKMEEKAQRTAEFMTAKDGFDLDAHKRIVLVEDVRSLWNVGSIFRTADGAGFAGLILAGITGCPPRKEIAKVSLGSEDNVDWNYAAISLDAIVDLKNKGYQIVALECTEVSNSLSDELAAGKISEPFCLVVGNEVTGISAEVLHSADIIVHLPMRGIKESLNVAVAFGIASYAISEALTKSQVLQ